MDKRALGVVVLVVGIVVLLVGGMTHAWWKAEVEEGTIGFGLRDVEGCAKGKGCETESYEKMPLQDQKTWVVFGNMAYFETIIIAVLGLLAAAATFASAATPRLRAGTARLSAALGGVALVLAAIFVFKRPEGMKELKAGFSMFTYFAGAFTVVVGGVLLAMQATPQQQARQ